MFCFTFCLSCCKYHLFEFWNSLLFIGISLRGKRSKGKGKGNLGQISFPFRLEHLPHRLYKNHLTRFFLYATVFSTSNTSNASFRFFQNGQGNLLMPLIKHMTSFYLFLDLSLTLEAQLKMFQIMSTLW